MSVHSSNTRGRFIATALALAILLVMVMPGVSAARTGGFYRQVNLVSDISGLAPLTDPNLVNPWGLSHSPTSPWWVSDNGMGVSTLYRGDGTKVPLVVSIPGPTDSTSSAPTGQVFNPTSDFIVSANGKSGKALFIFATEDGTISGWNSNVDPTHAILKADNSAAEAVYKGLALASTSSGNFLYATNFRAGSVDVFDGSFHQVHLAGSFTDPNIPAGFAPFGIQNINNQLLVSYAKQKLPEKKDDEAGPGNGFVDVFSPGGKFIRRLASRGALNSPWGLALAPDEFGKASNKLLVGNFGDGRINIFEIHSGTFLGQLKDAKNKPLTIDGLWGLAFGNDANAGRHDELFFTAGLNDEADGLFGKIRFVGDDD